MNKAVMSENLRQELALEIEAVFEVVEYPGENPKNIGNWWEIGRFLGKKSNEIALEDINTNWGLHHFTGKGFIYYLPVFLRAILLYPEEVDGLAREAVIKVLAPDDSVRWSTKNVLFTTELSANQITCIRKFLEMVEEIYPIWIKEWDFREILQRALNYWKSLDQS
jgi:hypothetical protein